MTQPVVPGYELRSLVGRGASSTVWSATRTSDGAAVAVKLVPGGVDSSSVAAAVREMSVLSRIDTPHVVRLHEALPLPDATIALVLDLADGGSLADVVAGRGHLSAGETVTVLSPLARVVADLHAAGVVHSDLSPGNVLFTSSGMPMLGDLGVSRVLGERPEHVHATAGFVAPEVAHGELPSPAADVYSIGALGWYALTGSAPPPIAVRPPLSTLAPQAPPRLIAVLDACMAPEPHDRMRPDRAAVELFDSAPAEAVLLASGRDPGAQLTHRIRAEAAASDGRPGERGPRGRWRSRRRASRSRAPAAPSPRRREHLRAVARWHPVAVAGSRRLPRVSRFAWGAVAGVVLVVVLLGAAAWQVTRRQAPSPAVAATRVSSSHAALRTDPRTLVQDLADARAGAFSAGSVDRLLEVDAPGSEALAADTKAVRAVVARAGRYDGLRLVVRSATTQQADGDTAQVRATTLTTAYRYREGTGVVATIPARTTDTMLHLRWTGRAWRVASITAVS